MKKLISFVVLTPAIAALIALALANRQPVLLSLDVVNTGNSALTVTAPLYLVILTSIVFGLLIGGLYTWARQGRWRRDAREQRFQARQWEHKARRESDRAEDIARSLPAA